MRRFLRDNGLTVALFGLFLISFVGQSLAGMWQENEERSEHAQPALSWSAYVRSGDFLEATFENWESEFLQMGAFLLLSAFLVQRGSAESKKPKDEEAGEGAAAGSTGEAEPERPGPEAPGPVHRGGWALRLYSHSLTITLLLLFVVSFILHGVAGARAHNDEAAAHGQPQLGTLAFFASSTFWFQSFQNWQSEFLSIGALVVLSIFLRQKGSPESKPVHAAHAETGA